MEKLSTPSSLLKLGVMYPEVYLVRPNEMDKVPMGIPFIVSSKKLAERNVWLGLLMPKLTKLYPYINWGKVYRQETGKSYKEVSFQRWRPIDDEFEGHAYDEGCTSHDKTLDDWSIENCMGKEGGISIDVLSELHLLPVFLEDVREAIKVNLTEMYGWTDGYNKKLGLCSGYMEEQPANRNLMIIDISSSIPMGVSASMLMLMKTMVDICNADLIVTASQSKFWSNDEVPDIDIEELEDWDRGNERCDFANIISELDLEAYSNLICFGDSDYPGELEYLEGCLRGSKQSLLNKRCGFKEIHSFWVTGCYDRYGSSYKNGAGYCRFAMEMNPSIPVTHHTDWSEIFD